MTSRSRGLTLIQERRRERARKASEFPIDEMEKMANPIIKEQNISNWFNIRKKDFETIVTTLEDLENENLEGIDADFKNNFKKTQDNFLKSLGAICKNKALASNNRTRKDSIIQSVYSFESKIANDPQLADQPVDLENSDDEETTERANNRPQNNDLSAQSDRLTNCVEKYRTAIDEAYEKIKQREDEIQDKDFKQFYSGRDFIAARSITNEYIQKFFEKKDNQNNNEEEEDDDMMIEQNGENDNKIINKCPLSLKPFENPTVILKCKRVCVFERSDLAAYFQSKTGFNPEDPSDPRNNRYNHNQNIDVLCPTTGCGTKFRWGDVHGGKHLKSCLERYYRDEDDE